MTVELAEDPKEVSLGASGWWYEVDYQGDLSAALSALQQRVLESGEYVHPWNTPWYESDDALDEDRLREAAQAPGVNVDELQVSMDRLKNGEPPVELEHLYALAGPDGTHSILDMMLGVGEEYMGVTSLEPAEYIRVFGTESPTLDDVRARKDELMGLRGRWMGTAITAYRDDGLPDKIVFTGFSGD